ncbi:MAG TPA: N-acetylglutaminylglutamine amidotransferase [Solirubrobacteraceae bacterium]|jgi:asparagine synthase (glutamine-hydrolysing)|nr:N-acetylglutaminylglutamine amidotransferase [Solirubrobacteraceae bacterium]
MCGLGGEVAWSRAPDLAALERIAEALKPRGPDGGGAWRESGVALVHRRLKIIDLSPRGDQPMLDPDLGLAIVFNGCIYNHRELRDELVAAGYAFRSSSDTEVILKAFHHWGAERFADHLIGMFAFAIVEQASGRVVLGRDRLGIKPLYLAEVDGGIRFASTLPALLAGGGGIDTDIDPVALHHYLSFHSVVPAPRTILRGVRKLPPATLMRIEPDGTCRERSYWSSTPETVDARTDADWEELTLTALRTAVRRRMVADVPVGVLLSGGLDSSLIVALLADEGQQRLQTFSIGFADAGGKRGDEFRYSDLVASEFCSEHQRIEVDSARLLPSIDATIAAMSEPMISHDCVAFHLLSEEVSRHVKVVQSGQGADEVFAGYSWYPPLADALGSGSEEYIGEFVDRSHAEASAMVDSRLRLGADPSRGLVERSFATAGASTPVNRALRLDREVMLIDDPVKRVDNMTMAWGLEARTPFLDHELVELAAGCPVELKLAHGGKGILKRISRGLLPDAVIDRPKGYFPVPALSHLEGEVLALVQDALTSERVERRAVFDPDYVQMLLADPNEHLTTLEGNKLWQVALLELWLEQHLS